MNYIGSKYSLLKEIETVLDTHDVPRGGVALDLFAGTRAVAQLLKLRGYVTYANDWQYYSYVTNVAFIEHNVFPVFDTLLADRLWGERIRAVPPEEEIVTYSIVSREPLTGNLDDHRRDNLAEQIPNVKGFSQLFVISHDDTFERGTDNLVRVVKENGVSRVEV